MSHTNKLLSLYTTVTLVQSELRRTHKAPGKRAVLPPPPLLHSDPPSRGPPLAACKRPPLRWRAEAAELACNSTGGGLGSVKTCSSDEGEKMCSKPSEQPTAIKPPGDSDGAAVSSAARATLLLLPGYEMDTENAACVSRLSQRWCGGQVGDIVGMGGNQVMKSPLV